MSIDELDILKQHFDALNLSESDLQIIEKQKNIARRHNISEEQWFNLILE